MSKRIVVAEDEPNIVESLKFLFEKTGFEVCVATDGRTALAMVLDDPPAVLVLDVMLPDIDGFEILRQLRGSSRGQQLPVLILTARGQAVDRETALSYGADRFMAKPFSNAEIIDVVLELAGGAD